MPQNLPAALDAELGRLLGAHGWRTDEAVRRAHGEDDSRRFALPDAVALPESAGQVAVLVRACRADRVLISGTAAPYLRGAISVTA